MKAFAIVLILIGSLGGLGGLGSLSASAKEQGKEATRTPSATINLPESCVNLLKQVISIANSGFAVDTIPTAKDLSFVKIVRSRIIATVPNGGGATANGGPFDLVYRVGFTYAGDPGVAEVTHLGDDSCEIKKLDLGK